MQEQPELVGVEAVATEAIRLYVELEILYPVLPLSSASVELLEGLGLVISGGEDKAPVRSLLHDFGLVDDPALLRPAPRFVEVLAEEPRLATRPFVLLGGLFEQIPGHLQKALVGYEGDGVGDALIFTVVVYSR